MQPRSEPETDYVTVEDRGDQRVIERLVVLLMSAPDWSSNYTRSAHIAKWVVREGRSVGWTVRVEDDR